LDEVFDLIPEEGSIWKETLIADVREHLRLAKHAARDIVDLLIAKGRVKTQFVPRPGTRPAVHLSRTPEPC
jgi:hypothetical protein